MGGTRRCVLLLVVLSLSACGADGDSTSTSNSTARPVASSASTSGPPIVARTDKSVAVAPPGSPVVELICCEYSPVEVTVQSKSATLFLVNGQSEADLNQMVRAVDLQHDLTIVGNNGLSLARSDRLAMGERATFTFDGLPAGSYEFFCTLRGHAVQGMRGKLRVEA